MTGVASIASEFEAFARWFEDDRKLASMSLGSVSNGFEGWVKIEFYLWMIVHRTNRLRLGLSEVDTDLWVECKALLNDEARAWSGKRKKQVDLCVRDLDGQAYHYVELKAFFCNGNRGKMCDAAGDDHWYVSRLDNKTTSIASGNTIILGVGFDEDSWAAALRRVRKRAELRDAHPLSGTGFFDVRRSIRWAVLSHIYRSGTPGPGTDREVCGTAIGAK